MVILVVLLNIIISLIFFYIAWQVWRLKQKLEILTDSLNTYEHLTYAILYQAPEKFYQPQQQIYNLLAKQQNLKLKIQQVQQIVNLLSLGRNIWKMYVLQS